MGPEPPGPGLVAVQQVLHHRHPVRAEPLVVQHVLDGPGVGADPEADEAQLLPRRQEVPRRGPRLPAREAGP